ncbi:DUF2637 domain-containing protein [Nocardia sp. NPDC020380]|uniref:DUF2637 domain-containing protein n=1 Tax=Nocardia sp. NPDC020380 TaxID=3364309 RepID=UPI0037B0915D
MPLIEKLVRTPDVAHASTAPARSEHRPSTAIRFFWCVLAASVTVSITGNATHAVLHANSMPVVAAAVAIVPPFALLAAVHGVTMMLRAHARSRIIHQLTTFMTVLIAAGAFRLSFTALRDLAIMAGIAEREAWIWPVIIEGSMAQATLALLAIAHTPTTCAHPTSAVRTPPGAAAPQATFSAQSDCGPAPDANACASEACTRDESFLNAEPWMQVARLVCAGDPARRRDPAVVAQVLTRHHDDGRNPSQIAREMNRSRSSVSRIISQSRQLLTSPALRWAMDPTCVDPQNIPDPALQQQNSVPSAQESSSQSHIG